MTGSIPEKPTLDGLEQKWRERWESEGTYRFDVTRPRAEVFSIDTPPPTVSGRLHPGHCCSYTHTDLLARFWRMRGREVFYPMGWDDNGLNVERRVQLMRGIICDPSLPYEADFVPPDPLPKRPIPVSRPNFVEQCAEVTAILEQSYFDLWSTLGLSVDWTHTYETIGDKARRTSQRGFLDLLERGLAYRSDAPTLWDVEYRTAIAQAELKDFETDGAYHKLRFEGGEGAPIWIDTTRPELLPACVALVAHPDDARYAGLLGTTARTPVFGAEVPVVAHPLADPDKGTGIAMICTFGDTTDVIWWRELGLPLRVIIQRDGRLVATAPEGVDPDAYAELSGLRVKAARAKVVEQLRAAGAMEGDPRPIKHAVKYWENGSQPLEIVTSQQWFVRYPPQDALLALGRKLEWVPEFMRIRYEDWVNGLVGDWNVTRQRFFGVPFPIWYPIADDGATQWESPITAGAERLPVDPTTDVPDGYTPDQRDQPGGFTADPDVMDTWCTSSLSPLIATGWVDDPELFAATYPMDLRPQAHDIIRTWLFYTIVRAYYAFGELPFEHVAISGFVVDPDRKKLSKSVGNASDDPVSLIAQYGADAVRYWAANGRPGMDVAFDENQFRVGRRLAVKVLNASRFALGLGDATSPAGQEAITDALDRSMLARLAVTVDVATATFESYDYTRALDEIERFFWDFCDNHLELVKERAYQGAGSAGASSAQASLRLALSTLLRLFAPFLAFVTEEVWSWWQTGSVHRVAWPLAEELRGVAGDGDPLVSTVAAAVLGEIRRAKTTAGASLRADVELVTVRAPSAELAALEAVAADLRAAGRVRELILSAGEELAVEVVLAPPA
jgi:valyl-tRNA synthetase